MTASTPVTLTADEHASKQAPAMPTSVQSVSVVQARLASTTA
ncbi:hypothetical protein [Polyangium jinanense]|nr:hypothetical protein [Polyangium jinanense]